MAWPFLLDGRGAGGFMLLYHFHHDSLIIVSQFTNAPPLQPILRKLAPAGAPEVHESSDELGITTFRVIRVVTKNFYTICFT
jgi:hypothetical protein